MTHWRIRSKNHSEEIHSGFCQIVSKSSTKFWTLERKLLPESSLSNFSVHLINSRNSGIDPAQNQLVAAHLMKIRSMNLELSFFIAASAATLADTSHWSCRNQRVSAQPQWKFSDYPKLLPKLGFTGQPLHKLHEKSTQHHDSFIRRNTEQTKRWMASNQPNQAPESEDGLFGKAGSLN